MAAPSYIPKNNAQEFQVLHILANTHNFLFVYFCRSHPNGYEVIFTIFNSKYFQKEKIFHFDLSGKST